MAQDQSQQSIQVFTADIFVRMGMDGNVVYSFKNRQWASVVNNYLYSLGILAGGEKLEEVKERYEGGETYYDVRMRPGVHDTYFKGKPFTVVEGTDTKKPEGFVGPTSNSTELKTRRENAIKILKNIEQVYHASKLHELNSVVALTSLFEKDIKGNYKKNPEYLLNIVRNYTPYGDVENSNQSQDSTEVRPLTCRRMLDLLLTSGSLSIEDNMKIKNLLAINERNSAADVDQKIADVHKLVILTSPSGKKALPTTTTTPTNVFSVFGNIGKSIFGPSSHSNTATTTTTTTTKAITTTTNAIVPPSVSTAKPVTTTTTTLSPVIPSPAISAATAELHDKIRHVFNAVQSTYNAHLKDVPELKFFAQHMTNEYLNDYLAKNTNAESLLGLLSQKLGDNLPVSNDRSKNFAILRLLMLLDLDVQKDYESLTRGNSLRDIVDAIEYVDGENKFQGVQSVFSLNVGEVSKSKGYYNRLFPSQGHGSAAVPPPPAPPAPALPSFDKSKSDIENEKAAKEINISAGLFKGLEKILEKDSVVTWPMLRANIVNLFQNSQINTSNFNIQLGEVLNASDVKFKQDSDSLNAFQRLERGLRQAYLNKDVAKKDFNKNNGNQDSLIEQLKRTGGQAALKKTGTDLNGFAKPVLNQTSGNALVDEIAATGKSQLKSVEQAPKSPRKDENAGQFDFKAMPKGGFVSKKAAAGVTATTVTTTATTTNTTTTTISPQTDSAPPPRPQGAPPSVPLVGINGSNIYNENNRGGLSTPRNNNNAHDTAQDQPAKFGFGRTGEKN